MTGAGSSQRSFTPNPVAEQAPASGAPEWNSEQLFGRAQEIGIRHEGHSYRLRRTRLGKLILTK
ncbi:MAG: hemin uptake protein HemP [Burkholderiaceae bacterium]